MPETPTNPLVPKENTVAMRLYGQGLGDCFLLAFPRPNEKRPFYLVIDCGIAKNTPDEGDRMKAIVADIRDATAVPGETTGNVDVLAVTHEHYDHLSGFIHAAEIWKNEIAVGRLWLPWTEKDGDKDADSIRKVKKTLNDAATKAVEDSLKPGASESEEEKNGLRAQAGFLGVALESPFGAAGNAERKTVNISEGFPLVKTLCPPENVIYCEPGFVLDMEGTNCLAYVLGPPRPTLPDGTPLTNKKGKPLIKLLEDPKEMFHYHDIGMESGEANALKSARTLTLDSRQGMNALASALVAHSGAQTDDDRDDNEQFSPFDASIRLDWDEAMATDFFWERYASIAPWRRVDQDWLSGAAELALVAGGITNNISLVLAFEMPQTKKILLFVGDAQVGNWLSWHEIPAWRPQNGAQPPAPKPDMQELLGRVAFYKVGHHGSHNATIKEKGLDMMPDGLLAYIPVSVPVAHDVMNYCPMPFYPVVRSLQKKTGGRVFLANGKLLEPIPPDKSETELNAGVVASTVLLPAKVKNGQTLEEPVPLFIEVTIEDRL